MELHIGLIGQGASGHGQGAGGIDAVEPAHAGRHEAGPAAGAAAHVEPFGIGRQLLPGEDGEVVAKHAFGFAGGHALLIEALPLLIAQTGKGTESRII